MTISNAKVRRVMTEKNFPRWKVADLLGVCEATVQRKLRHELPAEEQERWIKAINEATGHDNE